MDALLLIVGSQDLSVVVLVLGLAVYLGFVAYKRFNDLAPVPELANYTFTHQTIAWTSTKRFYAAAVVYIALTLGLFRLLLLAPDLVFGIADHLESLKEVYEGMQPQFVVPIAAALLLRFGPEQRAVAMVEEGVRSALQRMGAIPASVQRNHNTLSNASITVPDLLHPALRDNTDAAFPSELPAFDVRLQINTKLHRASYLNEIFTYWEEPGSAFQPFWARHAEYIRQLHREADQLAAQAKQFLSLPPESRQQLVGTEQDLGHGLSRLLRKQHYALACAVFAMHGDIATKEQAFRDLGFHFKSLEEDPTPPVAVVRAVLNDIAQVLLLFVFVAYPVAIAVLWALGVQPTDDPLWEVFGVWPLMAVALILASTLPALIVRRYDWATPRPKAGEPRRADRPYAAYLVATLAAAVTLPVAFALIKALFMPAEGGFAEQLQDYALFALLGGGMSLGLSFLLDTPLPNRLLSGTALGVFVACFGTIGYLGAGAEAGISGLTLTAALSFVIGFVNGVLIPYAYRGHATARIES